MAKLIRITKKLLLNLFNRYLTSQIDTCRDNAGNADASDEQNRNGPMKRFMLCSLHLHHIGKHKVYLQLWKNALKNGSRNLVLPKIKERMDKILIICSPFETISVTLKSYNVRLLV